MLETRDFQKRDSRCSLRIYFGTEVFLGCAMWGAHGVSYKSHGHRI